MKAIILLIPLLFYSPIAINKANISTTVNLSKSDSLELVLSRCRRQSDDAHLTAIANIIESRKVLKKQLEKIKTDTSQFFVIEIYDMSIGENVKYLIKK